MQDVSLRVLPAGGERTLRSLLDPWDPRCGETFLLPYRFFVVGHPAGWALVDCGVRPALAADPGARAGEQPGVSELMVGAEDTVVPQLARIGLRCDEIAHVVLTHMHYDHCGGLAQLPGATVHVQAAERRFAAAPPVYQAAAYVAEDWAPPIRWHETDGEHDVFGDGSVVAFPTPGHTPGHQSVQLRLADRHVILVGDAAYDPDTLRERRLPGFLWSPDAIIASWEELERRRRRDDAELVFSHH